MKKSAEKFGKRNILFYICGVKRNEGMEKARKIAVIYGANVREVVNEANARGVGEVIGVYQVGGSVVMLYWDGEERVGR